MGLFSRWLLSALRLLRGWQVTIGDIVVPVCVSWLGFVIAPSCLRRLQAKWSENEVAELPRNKSKKVQASLGS